MSLSLHCPCGARFEVEETFAGQEVACPECQGPVKAPPAHRAGPRRTSGYAIASLILALAGAFTVIGTLAAVLLGVAALIQVSRQRQRLAGSGYAVFGIVWGVIFTALSLFAYSSSELFGVGGMVREAMLSGEIDYTGPLEVLRHAEGFAITRPSEKWGVASESMDPHHWPHDHDLGVELILANVARQAQVDVTFVDLTRDRPGITSLEQCKDRVVDWFSDRRRLGRDPTEQILGFTRFKLRESRRLPQQGRVEIVEILLDVHLAGQPRTYLVRVIKRGDELYVLRGWASRRQFPRVEPEVRKALDSFRPLEN